MEFNLLDTLKEQLGGQLASNASKFLGEDENMISKALGGALPSLLGSVIKNGSSEEGASSIFKMLMDHDGGLLENITDLFGSGEDKISGLMESGSGIIESLLGSKAGGITNMMSSISGIKNSSASSLLKMAAPFLMGAIGKHVRRNGLNPAGLMDMLKDQESFVEKALPQGIGGLSGLFNLGDMAKETMANLSSKGEDLMQAASNKTEVAAEKGQEMVENVTEKSKEAISSVTTSAKGALESGKKTGSSVFKWLLPLLLIAGAAYLISKYSGCNQTATESSETIGENIEETIDQTTAALSSLSLPGGKELKVTKGSVVDQIFSFMGSESEEANKSFIFDGVNFENGSASLKGESQSQLNNLAYLLQAYESMKVQINNYSNNEIDPETNQSLSSTRADAIKKVLTGLGIDADRVLTKGIVLEETADIEGLLKTELIVLEK